MRAALRLEPTSNYLEDQNLRSSQFSGERWRTGPFSDRRRYRLSAFGFATNDHAEPLSIAHWDLRGHLEGVQPRKTFDQKEAGQGLEEITKAQQKDPAGIESIKKAEQKDKVQLEQEAQKALDEQKKAAEALKKKLADEVAKKAADEAMRRLNQNINMIDTGCGMNQMLRDILKDPTKAAKKYCCPPML